MLAQLHLLLAAGPHGNEKVKMTRRTLNRGERMVNMKTQVQLIGDWGETSKGGDLDGRSDEAKVR